MNFRFREEGYIVMLIFFDKNLVSKYFDIFGFYFYILCPEVEVSKAAPRKLESDHLPISPHRHRDNFSVAVKALLGQNMTISIDISPQIFKNHLISCLFSVFHQYAPKCKPPFKSSS